MAYKYREEIVGKRFLYVSGPGKLKLAKISDWEWRSGVVRAVSGKDTTNVELSILVEFDGISWDKREWIKIYEICQIFLVEYSVVLVPREFPNRSPSQMKWPALNFKPLIDKVGISNSRQKPVEFFVDRELLVTDEKEIINYKEGDDNFPSISEYPNLKESVKSWVDYQDGQKILLTTPTVLVGYRVEVYRAEGTTQWYTAVIKAYNHASQTLAVTDDTVLEAHNEDPALIQMRLIDDGVVDSILRGVEVGITSRRRPRNTKENDCKLNLLNTRPGRQSPFQRCAKSTKVVSVSRKTRQRHTSSGSSSSNNIDSGDTGCDVSNTQSNSRKKKRKIYPLREESVDVETAGSLPKNQCEEPTSKSQKSAKPSNARTPKSKNKHSKKPKRIRLKSKRNKNNFKGVSGVNVKSKATSGSRAVNAKGNLKSKRLSNSALGVISNHEVKSTENEVAKKSELPEKVPRKEFSAILTNKELEKLCIRNSTVSIKVKKLEDFPPEKISISLREKKVVPTSRENKKAEDLILSVKTQITKDESGSDNKESSSDFELKDKKLCNNTLKDASFSLKAKSANNGVKTLLEQSILAGIQDNMHFKKQFLLAGNNNSSGKQSPKQKSHLKEEPSSPSSQQQQKQQQPLPPPPPPSSQQQQQPQQQNPLAANIDFNRPVTDQITKLAKAEKLSQNGNDLPQSSCSSTAKSEAESVSVKNISPIVCKSADIPNEKSFSSIKKPVASEKMDYTTTDHSEERQISKSEWSRVEEIKNHKFSPTASPLIIDKHEPVHPYRDPELMRKNPVQSMLTPHKPLSSSYPNVPTAIPAGHGSLPTSNQLSTHQLQRTLIPQVPYPPHQLQSLGSLPPAHLPLPHAAALGQIEARGLTAPPLSTIAPQQQQQTQHPSHLTALQYPNTPLPLISSYSPLHSGLNNTQLDVLWQQQQKFAGVSNPQFMLNQHQEGLIREANILHERELDRERLERERLERERIERHLEQERLERDRQGKELAEREMEREREKVKKDKDLREERDRQEKDFQERQDSRQERQRVFMKTQEVNTAAAVNQHFIESLKRASQRDHLRPDNKIDDKADKFKYEKDAQQDGHVNTQRLACIDKVHDASRHPKHHKDDRLITSHQNKTYDGHLKVIDHRSEMKSDPSQGYSPHPENLSPHQRAGLIQQVKQEPNFSLYGYQPYQHSYISSDQLSLRGLTDKNTSRNERSHEPALQPDSTVKRKDLSVPPPLIKDGKPHNSVIVENKCRDGAKSVSPHNSLYGSPAAQSSKSISPTSLSYSDRIPDRTMTFSTSAPSVSYGSPHINSQSPRQAPSAHSSLSAFLISEKSRSQSPLQVASPQQLSAAVMQQPIDYRKTPPSNSSRNISTTSHNVQASNTSPQCSSNSGQHLSNSPYSNSNSLQNCNPRSITVISPHISQNAITLAHSYMVPSHSVVASSRESTVHVVSHSHATQMASKTYPPVVSSQHTNVYTSSNTPVSIKRKPVRENNNRKKIKPAPTAKIAPTPVTVPVTTPQILFNPSPYTTSNSSITTFHPTVSIPASVSVPTSGSSLLSSATRASGYMDSFRSFVENTVQNAFYQETADMPSTQNLQSRIIETEKQVPSAAIAIPSPVPSQRNKDVTSSVPPSLRPPLPPPHVSSPLTNSSVASPGKGSSTTSITITTSAVGTESTSRVVNGLIDTDSDTLSAPSPPPPPPKPDTCASPGRSANHPKLKKAWLQRHSDEDKVKESKPLKEEAGSEMGDVLKTCYVNCSYISPSKGGSKSPITSIRLANGTIKDLAKDSDESTSSASETDVQHEDDCSTGSKRHQHTYSQIDAKRIKTEVDSKSVCQESIYSTKKKNALGKVKLEGQTSKTSDASDCSNAEDSGENYMDSDVKDEASDSGSCSPRDSDIGFKEKRRNRRYKDFDEENICVNAGRQTPSKTSVAVLKRTGEPFLQDGPCREVTPKLMKCRECRLTPTQRSKKLPNIFCRFYEFRKLRYSQKGFLMIAGFSELSDAYANDIKSWEPNLPVKSPEIDASIAKYILSKVGDKFCELVEHEKEARSWAGKDAKVAWKRAVTGVREMCDVCDTTLFNIHWVCHKCGFVTCLDCYKSRKQLVDDDAAEEKKTKLPPEHEWLTCSANRQPHEPEKLMLTQIIPSNALWDLGQRIHEIRKKWSIKSNCTCESNLSKNGVNQEENQETENHVSSDNTKIPNGTEDNCNSNKNKKIRTSQPEKLSNYNPDANSPLCLLADVAMNSENSRDRTDPLLNKKEAEEKKSNTQEPLSPNTGGSDKKTPGCSTLRELLTKTAGKVKAGADSKKSSKPKTVRDTLEDIIQSVVGKAFPKENETVPMMKLMHYIPRMGPRIIAREIPILKHTLTETSVLYPDVPHSWLCDGRLLRLHEPKHKNNLPIFQEQWKQGSPVLVSGVQRYLKSKIWKPESFCEQFGHVDNDLVNCRTGDVWIGHSMKVFWDGFEYIRKRLRDKNNDPMLLKLKDWPPSDDFSDILPQRFLDLMQALPLPDYTNRVGILNLASRLPDFLVKPDLGPKMYNAYGSASFPSEGTTNLHLDVSDAVNVMVHVGIPDDGPNGRQDHVDAALKAIDEADCDIITKRRVREVNEIPGALWHIYCAEEADKIRDLLNKVGKENGQLIEPDHDPIHDQSWYLDADLRDRLNKEYGVHGYTIVQCLGDAVFIPAGAPHQVRNLHSCIKVAEDFVSPEHLNHCFRMTQEFRHLSDSHSNHEDKLQVKNIIYHAVKDAIAVLSDKPVE
ncbi:probable JmjC domain-containing histone demethylation protein 2C isoform X3 [Octopus sinensis]|uniref:[histone H3]-dimethyl-L-lysine(9) demethylase n=1 Tax=Octopus sinensis TaxID=2607531 RepID=A0A6P7T461_9MOLL|nr:probable JmjC domain-containing histone demethylation protein 2C isoform X3 [Octopus sinensis]